jgi:hypothetical protein
VSVQYEPQGWTILLVTVSEGNNGWGWWNYLWLDMDTIYYAGLSSSPLRLSSTGGGLKALISLYQDG